MKELKDMTVDEIINPMRHPEDGSFLHAPTQDIFVELIRRAKEWEDFKRHNEQMQEWKIKALQEANKK